jgi:AcrR family transcriptional regulator
LDVNDVNTVCKNAPVPIPANRPYHHGNLREALVRAGVDAARTGGSHALMLRDLAATVGVSPAAAYRHFPSLDHLASAVAQRAREELARSMITAREAVPSVPHGAHGAAAREAGWTRFMAVGRGYLDFAVLQSRLLEAAFAPCVAPDRPDDPDAWDVLAGGIDELARIDALPEARRAGAPLVAWSAVHGLALILASGALPGDVPVETAMTEVLDGVRRALER